VQERIGIDGGCSDRRVDSGVGDDLGEERSELRVDGLGLGDVAKANGEERGGL